MEKTTATFDYITLTINSLNTSMQLKKSDFLNPTTEFAVRYFRWCLQQVFELTLETPAPKYNEPVEMSYPLLIDITRELNFCLKHVQIKLVPWDIIKPGQKLQLALKIISMYVLSLYDNVSEFKEDFEKIVYKCKEGERLKEQLEEAIGVRNSLVNERDELKSNLQHKKKEVQKIDAALDKEKKRTDDINIFVENVKKLIVETNDKKELKNRLLKNIKEKESNYEFIKQHNSIEPKLNELRNNLEELKEENSELSETVNLKKNDLDDTNEHIINLEKLQIQIGELLLEKISYDDIKTKLSNQTDADKLEKEIKIKKEELENVNTTRDSQLSKIKSELSQIELEYGNCKQKLAAVQAKLSEKRDERSASIEEIKNLKLSILSLYKESVKVREEIAANSQFYLDQYHDLLLKVNSLHEFISSSLISINEM